ncbi:hypothetical protein, conserved in T. vivax [Trypanosoma vivax Y486]|uniref:Uncharacterized protein n=1 Tax=Trypanosoma vivax (strain Y486) TaxID=1055687 RepID=F9WTI9_TRYVY|nr:hypothetical protein, conserved in T. vivax [Trypanosoma vivax Y486]|eukprot:CCD20882.1 hypothetical protein, conserved in T. vivax [Trypanosoma vivax Y486]
MLATALVFLVLPTSLWRFGASGATCYLYKKELTEEEKCAARDILWGWLNVTNKCRVRALEVLKNVTELRGRAKEVEAKAKEAIAEYKKLLTVKTTAADNITSRIEKAIGEAQNALARVNNSRVNASVAEQAANSSLEGGVSESFYYIMLASQVISGHSCSATVNYTGAKEVLEMIRTENCNSYTNKYNVSVQLSNYAEQLDSIENLSEWKEQMVKLVYNAHEGVKSSVHSKKLWTIKDDEKVRTVMEAIKNSTDKLVVAVELFKATRVSVDVASTTVNTAVDDMNTVNKTVLSSLRGNGTLLCRLMGRHLEVSVQLNEANGRLTIIRGKTDSAAKAAENSLASVAATESLVKYVNGNISLLSLFGYSSVFHRLKELDIASGTTRNISDAKTDALMAVKLSGNARSNASTVGVEIQRKTASLKSIKSQLLKHLNETGINISSLTSEACDKGLSDLLNGSFVVAFGRAVGLNSSGVLTAQEALNKLKAEAGLINATLDDVNLKLKEAEKAMKDANRREEAVMRAVNNSIVDAANDTMKDLCETIKELHKLRLDFTLLNEEAEGILSNVSVLVGLSDATRSEMSEAIETIPNVAEYFGVANRELAVFARATKKIEKLRNMVRDDVTSLLESEMQRESHINTTHIDLMNKLFTNKGSSSTESNSPTRLAGLCVLTLPTNSPNVKAVDAFLMLRNLTDIRGLKTVADNIKLKVEKMRDSLRKASATLNSAEAAVKEAIETALQENGRRRCTPLYEQLFNAVRRFL